MNKQTRRFFNISLRILYGFFAVVFLLLLAYFFGYPLLSGGISIGNDSANAFTFISWLDRFFPTVPLWFPLQGTGVSFVQGYQVYPHLLVVWLHRLSSLSLIQAFELTNFLAILFSACGVYLLGWVKFRNQTIGFLAALFYLFSPLSWTWAAQAGFFAQSVSFVAFPLAFLFTDRFLHKLWDGQMTKKLLLDFLPAVVFTALTLLGHFSTFMSFFNLVFFYAVFYSVIRLCKKDFGVTKQSLLGLGVIFLVAVGLVAFWFIQLYTYISLANWDGSNAVDPALFPKLDVAYFLSIPQSTIVRQSVWDFAIPSVVWILAVGASVVSFFRSKRLFALSLVFLLSLYGSISNTIYTVTAQYFSLFASGFSPRVFWVVVQFLGPLLAAFTVWELCRLVVRKAVLASVCAIIISFFLLIMFRSIDTGTTSFAHYGPTSLFATGRTEDAYGGGRDLRDIWQRGMTHCIREGANHQQILLPDCRKRGEQTIRCSSNVDKRDAQFCEEAGYTVNWQSVISQLQLKNWPKPILGTVVASEAVAQYDLGKVLPPGAPLRIDASPLLGSILKEVNITRPDLSLVNVYTYQLSLNHTFWAMEQGSFYSASDPFFSDPTQNAELGKWFGTNKVLLTDKDPIERFRDAGVWDVSSQKNLTVATLHEQKQLAELTTKPTALVIGKLGNRAYEQVFRLATRGALSYDAAQLVMGKESIDDYSASELAKFDLLILHAYSYHNKQHAWELLNQYVTGGGNLYVDTGWQYTVPDFQMSQTPDLLPTTDLTWSNLPTRGTYVLEDKNFQGDFVPSHFAPLIYQDGSWGVSTAKSLKPWASVVLSYDGYPLVVKGDVGKGKIIWSGMNLFSHALSNDNKDEILFVNQLFAYLLAGKTTVTTPFTMDRSSPDKITFTPERATSSPATLFFREAYTPNWQASLVSSQGSKQNLTLYRGGPGLIVAPLPPIKQGDTIVFAYGLLPIQIAGYGVSLLTVVVVLFFVYDMVFKKGRMLTGMLRLLHSPFALSKKHVSRRIHTLRKSWSDEEEY